MELRYLVKELTVDHHPDRVEERRRIEQAGGRVVNVRVNGQLSLSRAIGDLPYKQHGVISTPELTGWHPISKNETFIIVASDGVFEKMTTQDTCDFLLQLKLRIGFGTKNLAELILSEALERGTMDNVAAVVVPLGLVLEEGIEIPDFEFPVLRGNEFPVLGSSVLEKDYFDLLTARFHSSLVEAKNKRFGCFYLSESLDEYTDYIFRDPNYDSYNDIVIHNSFHNSEPIYSNHHPVGLYKEHDFCWFFGLEDEEKDHCTNLYSFSKFIGLLDSLPNADTNSNDSSQFGSDFRYKLRRKFDRGSYGEVWLAFHWNCTQDFNELKNSSQNFCDNSKDCFKDSTSDLFILKRIMVERGNAAYLSGLREKYFGELFLNASNSLITTFLIEEESTGDLHFKTNFTNKSDEGLKHIARFVESFVSKSNEIWLVYKNEGISLSKMVYSAEETRVMTGTKDERERYVQVVRPSEWWYWLRTSQEGQKQMQDIIRQLLMAVKACHDRNITHRDVKPENMIICFEDVETGKCSREIPMKRKQKHLNMRLIDFGSAIDDFTMKHLYGTGPTRSEQTYEYTPPEALLNPNWFHVPNNLQMKYDMWSVGVVMLELILGSPHVFLISDRTRALLDQQLEGWSESTRELAYKLRSYMELCILLPGTSSHHHHHSSKFDHGGVSPASWKCSEESFSHQVKMKDPLKLGFPNIWALRLIRQLLVWHPEGRLSVDEALNHPYFQQN
ncbi:hypothetical protein LUZ60_004628 [Juncus effusus]|nr:hypothetical protein LUZ60_004628 [Juncus effusus]